MKRYTVQITEKNKVRKKYEFWPIQKYEFEKVIFGEVRLKYRYENGVHFDENPKYEFT